MYITIKYDFKYKIANTFQTRPMTNRIEIPISKSKGSIIVNSADDNFGGCFCPLFSGIFMRLCDNLLM